MPHARGSLADTTSPPGRPRDDPAAVEFERYAREHGPRLLRLAYLMTGKREIAEDVAQETLTSLLTHWSKVRAADDAEGSAGELS